MASLSSSESQLELFTVLRRYDPVTILIVNVGHAFGDARLAIAIVREHPRLMLQAFWMRSLHEQMPILVIEFPVDFLA